MADDGLWHLLIHTPGPEADPSVPFFEAPWFAAHRGFHAALREAGYLRVEIVPWRVVESVLE